MISENLQKPTDRADHILRAQRLFAMIAPVYDLMLARSMTRVYRMAVDLLLQTGLHASGSKRMPPAPTALDVGTGTGLFASELASSGFQVTAIDSCRAMLQVARRRRPRAANYIEAEAHLASRQPGAPFDIVCTGMSSTVCRAITVEVLVDMIQAARNAVVIVDYFPSQPDRRRRALGG